MGGMVEQGEHIKIDQGVIGDEKAQIGGEQIVRTIRYQENVEKEK